LPAFGTAKTLGIPLCRGGVASNPTMKILRRAFAKETETKILAEIPTHLTHHTIAEIEGLVTAL